MQPYFKDQPELKAWLDAHVYPTSRVRFITIRNLWIPKKHSAISLGFVVFMRESRYAPCDPKDAALVEVLIHELIHIRQQQRCLILPWYLAYVVLWCWVGFNYRKNWLEEVAYAGAAKLRKQYEREVLRKDDGV